MIGKEWGLDFTQFLGKTYDMDTADSGPKEEMLRTGSVCPKTLIEESVS